MSNIDQPGRHEHHNFQSTFRIGEVAVLNLGEDRYIPCIIREVHFMPWKVMFAVTTLDEGKYDVGPVYSNRLLKCTKKRVARMTPKARGALNIENVRFMRDYIDRHYEARFTDFNEAP